MMMYTNSDPQSVTSILRQQSDGSKEEVECPLALKSYNKYMGGVDRGDQLRGYYRCKVKSRKFYKYIFYFLIDVAITNAFILHQGWSGSSNKTPSRSSGSSWPKKLLEGTVVDVEVDVMVPHQTSSCIPLSSKETINISQAAKTSLH